MSITPTSSSRDPLLYAPAPGGGLRSGLQSLSRLLRRHWLIVAGSIALALAIAGAYLYFTPDMYRAESVLLSEESDPNDPDDALSLGFVPGPTEEGPDEQLLMLRESSALAQEVAAQLLGGSGTAAGPAGAESPEALARQLRATVEFTAYEPNAIGIAATSTDPREAARIADVYAEVAIAHARNESKRRLAESRAFAEERLASAEADLRDAEGALAGFMSREGTAGLDAEAAAVVNDGARLASSVREAAAALQARRASVRATETELGRIRPGLARRVASGVDREIEAAQTQIATLETRLEQFYQNTPEARSDPSDPRARPLRDEIAQWRQRVDDLSAQYVQETLAAGGSNAGDASSGISYATELERRLIDDRIAITGLEAQIAAQRGQLGSYAARRQSIPRQSVAVGQLERKRASAEQLYLYLANTLQEITIAENSEIGSLQLLRRATTPDAPLNRGPVQVLGLAALLGLLLGFGTALARSRIDARVHTPEDIEALGMPLLGVIPKVEDHAAAAEGGPMGNVVAVLDAQSAAAEAYRHLYSRIQFSRPDRVVEVVLVTSPEVGAGKSTTALNLAATMARANRRTLVIDADLRRPSVGRYLGVDGGPSLQSLIDRDGSLEDAEALVEGAFTPVWNLYALATSTPVEVPMELLTSERLRELLGAFRSRFDTIVIDTPPMMVASDAALLASQSDACLLVVSSGQTDTEALAQSRRELEDAGGHVIGVVLNQFDPAEARYKSTYGYRERHYASYHDLRVN
ncbi:polysaccharide biosynthesis tyrosine autokinase [Rubrivirga marina]|uniref:AAA domain-containing protein n=1 Tax=Rubrivirga marina TaxID=1196024 RepID=A0A271IXI4_9BACT|nr:polysaccharide biosynthesis tyrosine autokinase [Rubrivirga marina]PAP75956.1 hypothetical protein BSZ37_05635 [Rubrivirga marina]